VSGRHGKHRKRRPGVHKHHRSPEVRAWVREELVPERPSWMSPCTYQALAELRRNLESA
jgi:hypothetical protein